MNVRHWVTAVVVLERSTTTEVSATFIRMLARFDQTVELDLYRDGAELFAQALDEAVLIRLEAALAALPTNVPGVRIVEGRHLKTFLESAGPIGAIAAAALGPEALPVRAILFDKTSERNWALGWHQDRTIVVRERTDADGFGPWTVKSGLIQVEPPFDILERMVTLRVHLDQVDANNAPLRIVPGSHRLGRLSEAEVQGVVATSGERLCLAERGDVWLYATPIVHASLAADPPRRRRVLQVDYSADAAPHPLAWHGI
ncbi:phytanoyl-CoA dioxygenase family protein [Sphingomonas sp. PAMC 26617]|uniref:phytanoyl-CoA dioxygenase family protein n=1 Tax=Sphingomonas sp. PAMC 26617 TaxID=1112216 RepID=UPI000288DBF8|nr:phytanoyl-CoA dioxygenase family protein [Sphingomonas sp. PAMC 26617]